MKNFDVFLSYNWGVKPQVTALYRELTGKQGLKVWMDDFELGPERLADELSAAIHHSQVFLCCITKKYSESENCKDELDYAKNIKKPIIVLMLERLDMGELGGVGFIIGPKVRFNCYKNLEMFNHLSSDDTFKSIIEAIKHELATKEPAIDSNFSGNDTLISGDSLSEETCIQSISKQYFTLVQSDGNFVLYKGENTSKRDKPLWASNTWNSRNPRPFKLSLLNDGNLVLLDKANTPVWTSNTENRGEKGKHKLLLQNDGNLVLYDSAMKAIWATNTWKN